MAKATLSQGKSCWMLDEIVVMDYETTRRWLLLNIHIMPSQSGGLYRVGRMETYNRPDSATAVYGTSGGGLQLPLLEEPITEDDNYL